MRILVPLLLCAAAVPGCLDSRDGAAVADTSSSSEDVSAPATTDTATPADTTTAVDVSPTDAGQCVDVGGTCVTSARCCGDAFCPAEVSRNDGVCAAPLTDGESCYRDDWCASGVCNAEGTCGALECHDDDAECWYDEACCSGACFYDVASPYVPGKCGAPVANGAFCSRDSWCGSGNCYEGLCAAETCEEVEAECQGGWDCCTGVCSNEVQGRYGPGTCVARLAAGSVCYSDTWCASLSCGDDFTCADF